MRFSLILPIYNVSDYLEDCLLSIVSQDFRDFECLLIDDGSTDNSAEICAKFVNYNDNFKYYYKNNGGLSDARNFGLDRAAGEYVVFIDSDDLISPKTLFAVDLCISKNDSDIVYFNYKKFYAEKNDPLPLFNLDISSSSFYTISNIKLTQQPNFAWARVARRSMYSTIRFPVGFIYEDVLTSPMLSARAKTISHITTEMYGYRKRTNSITTGSAVKQFRLFETLQLLEENVNRNNINYKYYTTAFVNLIQSCLVSLVRIDSLTVRKKYIDLILAEYSKLSVRDIAGCWSLRKFKLLALLSKNKISLILISIALRQLVLFSDKKGSK
ncbi:glycosyltransferase family 2 protein [Enterobacter cancerogenus]|uniref:glycosyltransferase family 2 protein n=1 Tax=Enterobacter cancerogenus TaxID=69218 RepID=UPI003FA34509